MRNVCVCNTISKSNIFMWNIHISIRAPWKKSINMKCKYVILFLKAIYLCKISIYSVYKSMSWNDIFPRGRQEIVWIFTAMSSSDCKKHFWFSIQNLYRLADLLQSERKNNRRNHLSGVQQISIALDSYAGQPFQWANALDTDISQPCLSQVSNILIAVRCHLLS